VAIWKWALLPLVLLFSACADIEGDLRALQAAEAAEQELRDTGMDIDMEYRTISANMRGYIKATLSYSPLLEEPTGLEQLQREKLVNFFGAVNNLLNEHSGGLSNLEEMDWELRREVAQACSSRPSPLVECIQTREKIFLLKWYEDDYSYYF